MKPKITVMRHVLPGTLLVLLAACDGKPDAATLAQRAQELQGRIIEIASQTNRAAPTAVDQNTRLDGAQAAPGQLTISYTLVNAAVNGVDTTTFGTKIAPVVMQGSCGNTALRWIIDQGAVVVLEYRDLNGGVLGAVTVNRRTCSTPGSAPAATGAG